MIYKTQLIYIGGFFKMKRFLLPIIFFLLIGFVNVSGETTRLTKVYSFENDESGYAVLNNKDDSLLVTYYSHKNSNKGIFWYKQGKKVKTINGAVNGSISPDGSYYSYVKNSELCIFKENGSLVKKVNVVGDEQESIAWSYDSKQLYVCRYQNRKYNIYCINIQSGTMKLILRSNYYHPVPIIDNNKIFLLEDEVPYEPSNAKIIQYDLKTGKATLVKLPPIKDLFIYGEFTVSPDGRIVIFNSQGKIYVVDIVDQRIIDTFELPGEFEISETPDISNFSWKPDDSYVIFAYYSTKPEFGIYKYTLPKY